MNEYPPDENPPCCPACGTPWQDHDGASRTCKALQDARARIAELAAKCGRLQAVVDRLPKTADGVPVTPNMPVWCAFRCGVVHGTAWPCTGNRMFVRYEHAINLADDEYPVMATESDPWREAVYSTESAALAAKESTNGT